MDSSDQTTQGARLRRILFAFGLSSRGESLLRIAHRLSPQGGLQALHFLSEAGLSAEEISFRMADSFESVRALTDSLSANTMFVYRQTGNITASILDQARSFRAEVLLVGSALGSLQDPLGGRVAELIERAPCPIGISTGQILRTERISIVCDPAGDLLPVDLFAHAARSGSVTIHSTTELPAAIRETYPQFRCTVSGSPLPGPDACDLLVMDVSAWDRFSVPTELPALILVPPAIP